MRFILIPLLLLAAACAPAAQPQTVPTATTPPPTPTVEQAFTVATVTPAPAVVEATAPAAALDNTDALTVVAADIPAWQIIPLTNARTGEVFTFADFAGRTVYVEPFATWCTNCRAQMRRVVPVYEQLSSDVVFVSISVGENVSDEALVSYADREGFPWIFANTPPELLAELVNQFGRAVTTPPSTPHFIINPDGTFTDLSTGPEETDALASRLSGA